MVLDHQSLEKKPPVLGLGGFFLGWKRRLERQLLASGQGAYDEGGACGAIAYGVDVPVRGGDDGRTGRARSARGKPPLPPTRFPFRQR